MSRLHDVNFCYILSGHTTPGKWIYAAIAADLMGTPILHCSRVWSSINHPLFKRLEAERKLIIVVWNSGVYVVSDFKDPLTRGGILFIYLGFTSFSTLYRSYHDG